MMIDLIHQWSLLMINLVYYTTVGTTGTILVWYSRYRNGVCSTTVIVHKEDQTFIFKNFLWRNKLYFKSMYKHLSLYAFKF